MTNLEKDKNINGRVKGDKMNRQIIKRLTSFFLSFLIILPTISVLAIDWAAFQKDESRNGYTSDNIFLPLQLEYNINIGEELSGGILINSNDFFYTTKKGTIGSGNIFTGELLWKRNLNDEIVSCPVLSQYDIYVVTKNGTLFCIGQKTGVILWSVSLNQTTSAPLLKSFHYVYVATENGKIFCINSLDGYIVWTIDIYEPIKTALTYKNNTLFAVTEKGQISCIDSQNGKVYWNYFVGKTSHCPPIAGTEAVYFGDDEGNLYCFDYVTGRQLWVKQFSTAFQSSMVFAYFDKRVLCAGLENKYIGVTSGNGNEMWTYQSDKSKVSPVAAGRMIFVQGPKQTFVALDSFDGKEAFSIPMLANISTGIAICNGKIVFGTDTGKVFIYASAKYDFQIELKPSIQIASPGETIKYEVIIKSTEGFPDTIQFSVQGFPCTCKGVNRYFDETTVVPPKNINLIIEIGPEAEEARYNISVVGYSGRELRREVAGVLEIKGKKNNTSLDLMKPSSPVKSGSEFILDVNIQEAVNVRSISFMLAYPKELLFVQDVSKGDFFKGNSSNQMFDKMIQNEKGLTVIGFSRKDLSDSGSGNVARIIFKALKPGEAKITFFKYSIRDTFLWETMIKPNNLDLTILPGIQKKIVLTIGKKEIQVNGQTYPNDAPPILEKGRTLVPLRIITDNLESTINWEPKEQKITILHYTKRIELWINKPYCFVNGTEKDMPSNVPPRIINNRTYVPLLFIANELDATVEWNGKTQQITILYPAN